VQHVRVKLGCSERRTCRALGVARSTVRYIPQPREDESALTAAMTRLACQYGRYGYRRVHALLRSEGWSVSHSAIDIETCPECSGKLRVIACIEDPPLIAKILGHVQRREALIGNTPRSPPVLQPELTFT
jgi:hypothetical protein